MVRLCRAARQRVLQGRLLSPFRKSILRCVSIPHGGACPRNFHVDLTSARGHATLGVPAPEPQAGLCRDCGRSFAALPGATATWDDGVDGRALLCCLVFSVHDNPAQGAAMELLAKSGPISLSKASRAGRRTISAPPPRLTPDTRDPAVRHSGTASRAGRAASTGAHSDGPEGSPARQRREPSGCRLLFRFRPDLRLVTLLFRVL